MADSDQYRKEVEHEILQIMEEMLVKGEMTAERAREIARYILDALHPPMTLEKVRDVAINLDDHFPELIPIVIRASKEYDELLKKIIGEQAEKLLKQNKIDEANQLLKKALTQKK